MSKCKIKYLTYDKEAGVGVIQIGNETKEGGVEFSFKKDGDALYYISVLVVALNQLAEMAAEIEKGPA